MSVQQVITEHLDLWTDAVEYRKGGRGGSARIELTGIKKLRELILELAVRGKLVEQNPTDEPASVLLDRIAEEKARLVKEGKIRENKGILPVDRESAPFSLPEGWSWVRLGATMEMYNGKAFKASEWSKTGLPIVRIQNLNDPFAPMNFFHGDLDEKHKIDNGEFLISWSGTPGTSFGAFIWERGAAALNQHINKCVFFGDHLNPRFMKLAVNGQMSNFIQSAQGGVGLKHVTKGVLSNALIALPPFSEQCRIVEKVDELMALCDRLEQQVGDQIETHEVLVDTLLDALTRSADATELAKNWTRVAEHFDTLFTTDASIDKLEQTILQLGVMGRLVEQDARDEPAVELLKRIKLGKDQLWQSVKQRKPKPLPPISESEEPFPLPSGWTLSRLDDITDIQGGIAKGKKTAGKKTRTLPYLRVANVQRSSLDLSEIKEIEIAEEEVERYLVHQRDLLITEGGDWDKVGRTAIWDGRVVPMAHQNHVFRARLILVEQNERWLERYLNSHFARHYFASSSKQTTNLASINKTQLRSCTVPLPPLKEQYRIVKKIDELMALCDKLKERLNQASNTRRNLADAVVEESIT